MNTPFFKSAPTTFPFDYELQCPACGQHYAKNQLHSFCSQCNGSPIEVNFELSPAITKTDIIANERSMWRYARFLPLLNVENRVSLGEGWTPILPLNRLGDQLGLPQLLLKDESFNPTGSFKARGLSMAVSKAKELGIEGCIVPTAGNAGGALSAYCAKAGMKAIVVMPTHTPMAFKKECKAFGAQLVLVDGLINDCAKVATEIRKERPYFDLSTMKEPYRLEGKKTLGYELAEQLNWELPDVILYPAGGGTGLIGIWKAFQEMKQMGWVKQIPTKMIAVQAQNCKPLVDTFMGLQENCSSYTGLPSIANGLAVPRPFAEKMMLSVLAQSRGQAIAITETAIENSVKALARAEGLLLAPEGAALLAALKLLIRNKQLNADQKILLLNTGSAYKYLDSFEF